MSPGTLLLGLFQVQSLNQLNMATSSRWIPLESNPEVRVSVQRLRSVASDSASITPGLELRMFDLRYIYSYTILTLR